MADISNVENVRVVDRLMPDKITTTLSAYTTDTSQRLKPDIDLVSMLVKEFDYPVMPKGTTWSQTG
ncbi:MAG: N-acylglucosamine-6-phosphate 2-epimerase [Mesotoga sp.]|jgi:putative N-acetylmannosamine-6-phosphate epimerase|nr:N-acylglucosamine-6-phosphate 2-epimerase [Mesotoga sp.]